MPEKKAHRKKHFQIIIKLTFARIFFAGRVVLQLCCHLNVLELPKSNFFRGELFINDAESDRKYARPRVINRTLLSSNSRGAASRKCKGRADITDAPNAFIILAFQHVLRATLLFACPHLWPLSRASKMRVIKNKWHWNAAFALKRPLTFCEKKVRDVCGTLPNTLSWGLGCRKENVASGVRFKRVYAPLEYGKGKKPNFGWNVIKFEQKMWTGNSFITPSIRWKVGRQQNANVAWFFGFRLRLAFLDGNVSMSNAQGPADRNSALEFCIFNAL